MVEIIKGKQKGRVSDGTWKILLETKSTNGWRAINDVSVKIDLPVEVAEFMTSKPPPVIPPVAPPVVLPEVPEGAIPIPKDVAERMNQKENEIDKYRRLLDEKGITYDKRWAIKRLKQAYGNKKH